MPSSIKDWGYFTILFFENIIDLKHSRRTQEAFSPSLFATGYFLCPNLYHLRLRTFFLK